jgi:WD40 repeat protein
VGLSNGKIFYYKKKGMESRHLVASGKEHEKVKLESAMSHKGEIRRIIYTQIDGLDVLISGSADRTVKLWEPKNTKADKCFQTLIGHKGTIIDMIYLDKVKQLITSTTYGEMHIWRIDQARSLLMYPWFVESQRVRSFPSVARKLASNNDAG